jgi:hypothetical protein
MAPPRVRFFFWLVLHGCCWTAERRFRHGLQATSTCILCDQGCETIDHILVGCVYSREVWHRCFTWLGLHGLDFGLKERVIQWWLCTRKMIPVFGEGALILSSFLCAGDYGRSGMTERLMELSRRRGGWHWRSRRKRSCGASPVIGT